MIDQKKNFLIGIFVLAAVGLIVYLILFINPELGDEGKTLRVRFANIDKVNTGTHVTFGGNPVGEVIEIKKIIDQKNPRPDFEGVVYAYELLLSVDSSVNVYNTDQISLRTSGLLGEKSVNITPLPPKPGEPLINVENQVLYANESGGVDETLKEFKELSDTFEETLQEITSTLKDVKRNRLIEKVAGTFQNMEEITQAINKPEKLENILDNVEVFTKNLLNSWSKIDDTIDDIASAAQSANTMMSVGQQIFSSIQQGKGTVGRLIESEDFYLRLTSLTNKAEVLFNDINHYGILFNLDKRWQRTRAKRMNLLYTLSTPAQFRSYFNNEISQINTSLSRLVNVMERQDLPFSERLCKNPEYEKVLADLIRKISDLDEHINMYNTQLMYNKVQDTEFKAK